MMRSIYPTAIILGFCLTPFCLAEDAAAQASEQQASYDALVQEAVEHYSEGRYEAAITRFKAAFDILSEPELLYNIGRCYERIANSEEALNWYQKFLDTPGTTGELRTRALTNIAALKREIAAKEAVERADKGQGGATGMRSDGLPEDDDTGIEGAGGDVVNTEDDTDANYSANTPKETSDTSDRSRASRRLKVTGLTLLGIGAAGMVAGGVIGGFALASQKDYDDAEFTPDRIGYREDMMRNALIFDIVFSSGAVLTAVGGALLIAHTLKHPTERETARGKTTTSTRYGHHASGNLKPIILIGGGQVVGGFGGRF